MDIALIIPAYNEAETIEEVINTAKNTNLFSEIVVVSDGSTDDTVQCAKRCGVETIALADNQGKGAAMAVGVENTTSEIVLFLDGDLVNLRAIHIKKLLEPIINNQVDMTCGIFNQGRDHTDFAQKITPWLTGQRALRRKQIENCTDLGQSKFGAELSLTKVAIEEELTVKKIELEGLTHKTKEEKIGLLKGFIARMKMYWEVFNYFRQHNLTYDSLSAVLE